MGSFMKTKITSFLSFALIGLLALSTSAFADMEAGFYEKDHIRGFISIGGAYNGMRSEFQDYVNTMAFYNGRHIEEVTTTDEEGTKSWIPSTTRETSSTPSSKTISSGCM